MHTCVTSLDASRCGAGCTCNITEAETCEPCTQFRAERKAQQAAMAPAEPEAQREKQVTAEAEVPSLS